MKVGGESVTVRSNDSVVRNVGRAPGRAKTLRGVFIALIRRAYV